MKKFIEIIGARIHNLKNIDIRIPRNELTVITGVSGSGKSSLAFDTLFEEGRRRYLLFSGAQFMVDSKQHFKSITGLSPTVAVEQRIIRQSNLRSTVGTRTKIGNLLAILYATCGKRDPRFIDGLPLSMEMFLKNSPTGMCVKCLGVGSIHKVDEEMLFCDVTIAVDELVYGIAKRGTTKRMLDQFCKYHGLSADQSLDTLTEEQLLQVKYGDGGKTIFPGYIPLIMQICKSLKGRLRYLLLKDGYLTRTICPKCNGTGLAEIAAHTMFFEKTITELETMGIKELYDFLNTAKLQLSGINLLEEILVKLECMVDIGLHHLALSRAIPTLSGGEIQRLFLASYIIAEMDSIIFIFDEPTIGLHEVEKEKLIGIIKNIVKRGNTVVAVEHDRNFMLASDYIIDLGPDAGIYGGDRIFQGTMSDFIAHKDSRTAPYLSGEKRLTTKENYKPFDDSKLLTIENAALHNLKNVYVSIPLGLMVGIAGVSGSGKSSLINDTLVPKLKEILKKEFVNGEEGDDEEISADNVIVTGTEHIRKCIVVDQKPIGRSKTSCPATYTGIYDRVRSLFANTPEAREKGHTVSLFTVNSEGGCRICKGNGINYHHVGYGNFVELECEVCGGTGFVEEAMRITLEGKNIKEILAMSVAEAVEFFGRKDSQAYDRNIFNKLKTLAHVGLGYITLGQKTPTISGGEAQRIKLAKELSKQNGQDNVYILDEPTTGLSFADTQRLLELMQQLNDAGNTIIVTEHDPSVLGNCDYIIELGPGGGHDGGFVIAKGTPEQLKADRESIIGKYL